MHTVEIGRLVLGTVGGEGSFGGQAPKALFLLSGGRIPQTPSRGVGFVSGWSAKW